MANFQQMVLDYLEHYQPDEFATLKAQRRLRSRLNELVDRLYREEERELSLLTERYPDEDEELLVLCAERQAIESVLPIPESGIGTQRAEGRREGARLSLVTEGLRSMANEAAFAGTVKD